MSFRRFPFQVGDTSPFERFNTRSQEDRNMFYDTNPIRRSYWNDLDTTTSHFDEPTWRNPPPFRNSGSMPGSPQTGHRSASPSWPEGSIPIKVVHEKSSKSTSSESSDGQTCSRGSSPSVNSEPSREPRIHHIPIMVEPRGDSNSSHINSKSNEQSKTSYSKQGTENMQNSASSKHSQGKFSTKTHLNNESPKPTVDDTSEDANHQPRVCHIPIMVEPRVEPTTHSPDKTTTKKTSPFQGFPPRSNSSNQPFEGPSFSTRKTESAPHLSEHKTPKKPSSKQNIGPHVSKVPINVGEPAQMKTNQTSNAADFALNQIAKVKNEMVGLKKQVEDFSGLFQDKQYRYLDEMLTQCMLKLDNIDTGGLDEVRKARKVAINEVQTCISLLESKITRKSSKSDNDVTQEAMDICKQSEEVLDKPRNNIPSEEIEKGNIQSVKNEDESEVMEEKTTLSEINNKKIKVEDTSGVSMKRQAEKMEIDAAGTNAAVQAMEIENVTGKHSQNVHAKEPEVRTDRVSSFDISKSTVPKQ